MSEMSTTYSHFYFLQFAVIEQMIEISAPLVFSHKITVWLVTYD